ICLVQFYIILSGIIKYALPADMYLFITVYGNVQRFIRIAEMGPYRIVPLILQNDIKEKGCEQSRIL
ncbi:MAG: hypothetical protein IKU06_04935, partial [Lachnospiraceae bacterium]|nr:hypothetical protein [Lachnospiraceae bacterium]